MYECVGTAALGTLPQLSEGYPREEEMVAFLSRLPHSEAIESLSRRSNHCADRALTSFFLDLDERGEAEEVVTRHTQEAGHCARILPTTPLRSKGV